MLTAVAKNIVLALLLVYAAGFAQADDNARSEVTMRIIPDHEAGPEDVVRRISLPAQGDGRDRDPSASGHERRSVRGDSSREKEDSQRRLDVEGRRPLRGSTKSDGQDRNANR